MNFGILYNEAKADMSYAPATGTVLFNNAEPYAIVRVQLESQRFLRLNSTFTVTLTEALFVGDGGMLCFKWDYYSCTLKELHPP